MSQQFVARQNADAEEFNYRTHNLNFVLICVLEGGRRRLKIERLKKIHDYCGTKIGLGSTHNQANDDKRRIDKSIVILGEEAKIGIEGSVSLSLFA
jgi:hypothetical protein